MHCYSSSNAKFNSIEIDSRELVNNLSLLEFDELRLSGGEPLCYSNFSRLIEYLQAKSIKYSITTNGQLLKGKIKETLLGHPPCSLNFSFLSTVDTIHDRLTKTNGSYKLIIAGLKWCADHKIKARVNYSLFKSGINNIYNFLVCLKNIGVSEVRFFPIYPNGRAFQIYKEESLNAVEYIDFVNLLEKLSAKLKPLMLSIRPRYGTGNDLFFSQAKDKNRCLLNSYTFLTIEPTGLIYPCCYLSGREEYLIGSLDQEIARKMSYFHSSNSGYKWDLPCSCNKSHFQVCPMLVKKIY